ncbi:unnamed protein product [Symbiodinium natans]|uniref:Uncharacterized protein n=1 Tax=Symbiodinium natans TaxID=878477 RepID=A0A812JRH0_9DINO|nr:unnamed protein product [Symbiodinium natans]
MRMDNWRQGFKRAVVRAGPLEGARFLDVTDEWLARAARQYSEDKRFEKFARMATGSEPAPGTPAPASARVVAQPLVRPCRVARAGVARSTPVQVRFMRWAGDRLHALPRLAKLCLLLSCVLLLAKPLAMTVLARLLGAVARLVFRRVLHLVGFVVEQLLEELLQQASDAVTVPFSPGQHQCPAQLSWPLLTQVLLTATSSLAGAFVHCLYIRLTRRVIRLA